MRRRKSRSTSITRLSDAAIVALWYVPESFDEIVITTALSPAAVIFSYISVKEAGLGWLDVGRTSLDVNLGPSSDEFNKRQMIADFEAELRAIYAEEEALIDLERQKQKEIYQRYQDISDGIIIF